MLLITKSQLLMSLPPEELLSFPVLSMSLLNLKSLSLSESGVSTNLTPDLSVFSDFSDLGKFTTVPSLELTKPALICWEKLNLTSLSGTYFYNSRYPTLETIRKLVLKRGYGKINHQRIPLTNNRLVESTLGKHGINSVEDLIHEIHTVGPHFKEANNFLWTFKLRGPRGGFSQKRHPFQRRGDWGNREVLINDLIKRMLWFYLK